MIDRPAHAATTSHKTTAFEPKYCEHDADRGQENAEKQKGSGASQDIVIQGKFIPKKPVRNVIGKKIVATSVSRLTCSPCRSASAVV
jgi:hypothetical protein